MPEINYENIKESSILTDEEVYDYYKTVTQDVEEIAKHFGVSVSNVNLRLTRAHNNERLNNFEILGGLPHELQ